MAGCSCTLGLLKGLIPLMAVLQENKRKVQPVMDYHALNEHLDTYTAGAGVCAQKLRVVTARVKCCFIRCVPDVPADPH